MQLSLQLQNMLVSKNHLATMLLYLVQGLLNINPYYIPQLLVTINQRRRKVVNSGGGAN